MNPNFIRGCLALFLFLIFNLVHSSIEVTQFNDVQQLNRYQSLISQLRCLVCQNQNLAESDAGLARDLKRLVKEKIKAGETDSQILDFMSQRYGDFVLYRPVFKSKTWLLWFGPVFFLAIGIFIVLYSIKNQRKRIKPLSDQQLKNANRLLNEND